ncbi:MAG: small ribosomal subunit Rsm22 family protein [Pseudomonadota bacterium]|nr:small ribosomal subunit Rsm22 family protein [Pseudomonadota bacterium]
MHHSQLAAQFLIDTYRFNQEDKNRLTHIFEAYKNPEKTQTQIPDQRTAAAYMIARGLSISGVMQHIFEQEPAFFSKIKNVIDFGGGPGTFLWSLLDHTQDVHYSNIDMNKHLLNVFKEIANHLNLAEQAQAVQQDYFQFKAIENQYDLAVFSYTLCENPGAIKAIDKATHISENILIIEPGTPLGFKNILQSRALLIDKGFSVLAPCSHMQTCPLQESESDWCHFVARNMRTKTQMFLKSAERGYEDEKFIYLIATKSESEGNEGQRIISRPQLNGHILHFDICTPSEKTVVKLYKKSDKALFKEYKKAKRGDIFNNSVEKPF